MHNIGKLNKTQPGTAGQPEKKTWLIWDYIKN